MGSSGWRRLRFFTPSRGLPHGASGTITLLLGMWITRGMLWNDYSAAESWWAVPIFLATGTQNALAGWALVRKAPSSRRGAFRFGAVLQLSLLWYVFRFRPPGVLPLGSDSLLQPLVRCGDLVSATCLLGTMAGSLFAARQVARDRSVALGASIVLGVLALLTVCAWPLHIAGGGEAWLECVHAQYPKQRVGLTGYVYVPIVTLLAAFFFFGTLMDRGLIRNPAAPPQGETSIASFRVLLRPRKEARKHASLCCVGRAHLRQGLGGVFRGPHRRPGLRA